MYPTRMLLPLLASLALGCSKSVPGIDTAAMGYRDYIAEANAVVTTLSVEEAIGLLGDSSVAFVDVREQSELDGAGQIPGAIHVPRGFLEFYIDSTSPMHDAVFSSGKRIVFYCAGGARSALAAKLAMDMGVKDVAHVGGGFRAWTAAGGPVARPTAVAGG